MDEKTRSLISARVTLMHKARTRQLEARQLAAIFADPTTTAEQRAAALAAMANLQAADAADTSHRCSLDIYEACSREETPGKRARLRAWLRQRWRP